MFFEQEINQLKAVINSNSLHNSKELTKLMNQLLEKRSVKNTLLNLKILCDLIITINNTVLNEGVIPDLLARLEHKTIKFRPGEQIAQNDAARKIISINLSKLINPRFDKTAARNLETLRANQRSLETLTQSISSIDSLPGVELRLLFDKEENNYLFNYLDNVHNVVKTFEDMVNQAYPHKHSLGDDFGIYIFGDIKYDARHRKLNLKALLAVDFKKKPVVFFVKDTNNIPIQDTLVTCYLKQLNYIKTFALKGSISKKDNIKNKFNAGLAAALKDVITLQDETNFNHLVLPQPDLTYLSDMKIDDEELISSDPIEVIAIGNNLQPADFNSNDKIKFTLISDKMLASFAERLYRIEAVARALKSTLKIFSQLAQFMSQAKDKPGLVNSLNQLKVVKSKIESNYQESQLLLVDDKFSLNTALNDFSKLFIDEIPPKIVEIDTRISALGDQAIKDDNSYASELNKIYWQLCNAERLLAKFDDYCPYYRALGESLIRKYDNLDSRFTPLQDKLKNLGTRYQELKKDKYYIDNPNSDDLQTIDYNITMANAKMSSAIQQFDSCPKPDNYLIFDAVANCITNASTALDEFDGYCAQIETGIQGQIILRNNSNKFNTSVLASSYPNNFIATGLTTLSNKVEEKEVTLSAAPRL
jgi:hypothetical protein